MTTNEVQRKIVLERTHTYFVPYDLWYKSTHVEDITESWLKEQKTLAEDCEVRNREIESQTLKRVGVIKSEIKEIYGENSKIFKYIKNALGTQFNHKPRLLEALKREEERFKKNQKEILDIQKKEFQEEYNLKLTQEAIIFLEKNGKQIGIDFSIETAIGEANSLAFDILVAEKIKENKEKGTLFSFGGEDNCEGCGGWDGSSRRCECGNRRVSWEHGGDFRDMYIYGEAY